MNELKLNKFINEYNGTFKFKNENILHEIVNSIQTNINFAFALEVEKRDNFFPKLILSEDFEDIASNKTNAYKQPMIYIALKERKSVSADNSNTFQTFAQTNVISGIPRFFKTQKKGDKTIEYASMTYDNRFELILLTKNIKEQLEMINILERALNVYSNVIRKDSIIASGIVSIKSSSKKTNDQLTKTVIELDVRTKEIVEIDKNYILIGYKIFTNEYETGSGYINKEDNWEEYPKDGDFIEFP